MQWALIGILSATGVVMGLVTSLVGLSPSIEPWVWTVLFIVWTILFVQREVATPVRHGAVAGLATGLWTGLIQAVLVGSYTANNPWYATELADPAGGSSAAFIGQGLVMGLIFGLFFGALAFGIQRVKARRAASPR